MSLKKLIKYFRRKKFHYFINITFLIFTAILFLLPFIWMIAGSFKDKTVANLYLFFPPLSQWSSETMNWNNFKELFKGESSFQGTVYFWQYILNSLFISCTSTVLQLFTSSMAGFALAKYRFKGKSLINAFMMGSMMIPPMILLAPLYQIIYWLGWMDSFYALIIPSSVSAFGILLFKQATQGVPHEILEAARIDGCNELRLYYRIVMPLLKPFSASFCLISFLASWSSFLAPNVFLHSQENLTLSVVLNMYVGRFSEQYGVFLAGTLIAIIPPAILFFLLQKEFVRGITSGALKG